MLISSLTNLPRLINNAQLSKTDNIYTNMAALQ